MTLRCYVFALLLVCVFHTRSLATANERPLPSCGIVRIDDLTNADRELLLSRVERMYIDILGASINITNRTLLPYNDLIVNPATGMTILQPKTATAVAVIFKALPLVKTPIKDPIRAQMTNHYFDWKGHKAHIARYMGASVEGEERKKLPEGYDMYMVAPLALEIVPDDTKVCKPPGVPI